MTDDKVIQHVIDDIADYYHDLDDSGDGPFGEFARITVEGDSVLLRHETEDQPCVRITVEVVK